MEREGNTSRFQAHGKAAALASSALAVVQFPLHCRRRSCRKPENMIELILSSLCFRWLDRSVRTGR